MFGLKRAPRLCGSGLTWFNVERPLDFDDLRGRLVILDFWTPCCVNCIHVLPMLKRLGTQYPDRIAVIGIHCPKYPAERHPDSARHAIARHDIRHPVIHDPELQLWAAYNVSCWPTLVFVGPDGMVLGNLPGEPCPDKLALGIGEMMRTWRHDCGARPTSLPLTVPHRCGGRLRFPTKIKPLALPGIGKAWAIADSGHHQVVVIDDCGREVRRFGCGKPGFVDLDAESSAFNAPQGLVGSSLEIYVADTGNHAIRRIDLATGGISTLAGTGERGPPLHRATLGTSVALASAWDLDLCNDQLYFANAGTHQLGVLNLKSGKIFPLAGCGHEEMEDGEAGTAKLAQPTGLALSIDASTLFFADSETSSVRAVRLHPKPCVSTLVGHGLAKFESPYGGCPDNHLQHCQGVGSWGDRLVIADSYNDAVRIIDLRTRKISESVDETWIWDCEPGLCGGEPAGVVADGQNRLLVADTNHHRILELDLSRRHVRALVT